MTPREQIGMKPSSMDNITRFRCFLLKGQISKSQMSAVGRHSMKLFTMLRLKLLRCFCPVALRPMLKIIGAERLCTTQRKTVSRMSLLFCLKQEQMLMFRIMPVKRR